MDSACGRIRRVRASPEPPSAAGIIALLALVAGVLVSIAAPALAAVDDEPSGLIPSSTTLAQVRALYERAHPREHGRNVTILEDWRLQQDGTTGTYRVNRLGRDEREVTQLGPLAYARGVLHAVHWEQNRNGIVFTYPGVHEQHDAADERAFRDPAEEHGVRLIGESVPLNAYVVELNPAGGRHAWWYVDKRSGAIVRRERVERRRRYVTTYDDFRPVDGVLEASRIRQTDSLGNEREQTLISRTLDDTPDLRDVEMPASRKLVEFPDKPASEKAGADKSGALKLPVRFVNGLAVVRVTVGRGAYDFLLDSGAAGIVVDPGVVEQQGLERYGNRVGSTLGAFPESTTIVGQMSVGPLKLRNVVARVVAVPFHPDERTRIAGLLGFDFFADAVVHFDPERNLVEALAPERFRAPADTSAVAIGLDDKTPAVRVRAGSAAARVVLDTGANRSLFETAFADRADFAPDRVASTQHFRGMGGFASAETTRMPALELGGLWTRDATVDVSSADLGSEDVDGIIGSDLLRAYDVWFDYRTSAVYLRRAQPPPPPAPRRGRR